LFSPRLDKKNRSVVRWDPVWTCRSVKNWSSPLLFGVPSTLKSFLGSLRHWIGRWRYFAYSRFMKFSVAPESNRAMVSALFNLEWRKVRMVMDFLFEINTFDV
jgi:hypothetical protein